MLTYNDLYRVTTPRISRERFRSGKLFRFEILPQTARAAERRNPAFS